MKLIPLHDETAAIACTITEAEIPGRIALIEAMRAALVALERTEHGMLLRFPNDVDVEAQVRQFAIDEKRCCEFWGFGIRVDGEGLTLQWDAPDGASDLVDRLAEFFHGTAPASSLRGLL